MIFTDIGTFQLLQPLGMFQQEVQARGMFQKEVSKLGMFQQEVQELGMFQQEVQTLGIFQQEVQALGMFQKEVQALVGEIGVVSNISVVYQVGVAVENKPQTLIVWFETENKIGYTAFQSWTGGQKQ